MERGMRIAVATHAYYPHYGGVTENVSGSARALRDRGHRVTIVTAGPRLGGDAPGIVRLGRQCMVPWNGATVNLTFGLRLERELQAALRDIDPDLVHVHCPLAPMLPIAAVRAASRAAVPVVGTFHATARWNIGYHLCRRLLRHDWQRLDRRLAVSASARRFVHRYFPGDYEIVPNGVDPVRFAPASRPPDTGRAHRTVLFVGRLDPRKGVEHLIDAVGLVRRRLGDTVRLDVIGDGPRRRRLQARAARLGPRAVRFLGPVTPDALPRHLATADVVCSPATRNESFGIVLLEAMACARPLIATDIPGYRLLIEHGENGLLVPPGRVAPLSEAMIAVLTDETMAHRIGQTARRHAHRYGWDTVAARLETIYSDLTGATVGRIPELAPELEVVESV
jgi:phosphatidylinositol alpha-mannosyltransferase